MPSTKLTSSEIHVRDAGRGTPVVLLHGNFASHAWWSRQLDEPPRGHRLIAPDLPGCGRSPPPGDEAGYALPALAKSIEAVLDQLALRKFHLVGHSLGAGVALYLALENRARVETMTLVAPAPLDGTQGLRGSGTRVSRALAFYDPRSPARVRWLEASMRGARMLGTYQRHIERALAEQLPSDRVEPNHRRALLGIALRQSPSTTVGFLRALSEMNLRSEAAHLDIKTSIIWGTRDEVVPRRAVVEMEKTLPRAVLSVWDGVGHAPQVEAPARFSDHLVTTIDQRRPRGRIRRLLQRLGAARPGSA